MSLTVQQMVLDAKKLVKKLRDSDSAADTLISKSQNVYKLLDTRKFSEDGLQSCEGSKQNTLCSSNIHHESVHLRQLQKENEELRCALDDYNLAVEMIMSKYRQEVTEVVDTCRLDLPDLQKKYELQCVDEMPERIREMSERIQEMGSLMSLAARLDENYDIKTAQLISRLTVENRGLRQLLKLSNNYNPIDTTDPNETDDQHLNASQLPPVEEKADD